MYRLNLFAYYNIRPYINIDFPVIYFNAEYNYSPEIVVMKKGKNRAMFIYLSFFKL